MTSRDTAAALAADLFDALGRALRHRHAGLNCAAPDWLDPLAVDALIQPLQPAQGGLLGVVLRDGISPRSLPRQVQHRAGGVVLTLRCVRGEPARPQGGPPTLQRDGGDTFGTAAAVVRDRLAPQRNYLLGCAHVLAPDAASRHGDVFVVDTGDGQTLSGTLCEWTPALGKGCPPSSLDAALLEVDAAAALALREHQADRGWLPEGLSDDIAPNRAVTLLRPEGPLRGSLAVRWSGRVDVGNDGYPDYFLQGAIGYVTHGGTTQAGDSGSPVWTEERDLIGMHLAGIAPDSAFGASGLMGRIVPALDWFRVKPYTRLDPATLDAGRRPGTTTRRAEPAAAAPLQLGAEASGGRTVLAQTLWGEARGEGELGMRAVACVVLNRLRKRYRGKQTVAEVCLDPQQFSCWNLNDPNRPELDRVVRRADASFALALAVADLALADLALDPRAAPRKLPDITDGARHYVAASLRLRPDWLRGHRPCAVIGQHEFYNDIA